ncbi:ATP-binding cassette domain-containing protein, partial [uncultured Fretibacterium sp.]|uniref:ATP-binding cassette domain-containing protein n=1 Tax=uncultured Fretibacterium sp. TaxID=1678694 RepID=UPI00262E4651
MTMEEKGAPMLEVVGLKKYFEVAAGTVRSVDGVTFDILPGETLGLVGESGCGKTTTGRTIVRLYDPTGGTVRFMGQDITRLSQGAMLPWRKRMQMIFQDPYASLNPRMTVGDIVMEPMSIHGIPKDEWGDRMRRLMKLVGLNSEHANR